MLRRTFAVQVLYCRDKPGSPNDKLNVNGDAIDSKTAVLGNQRRRLLWRSA